MEQLLNKLIDMGWKPWGREKKSDEDNLYDKNRKKFCIFWNYNEYGVPQNIARYSLRELVSKESGLWQYVCENELLPKECLEDIDRELYDESEHWKSSFGKLVYTYEYEYWLIESSLRDESELEDFLLDNIKID